MLINELKKEDNNINLAIKKISLLVILCVTERSMRKVIFAAILMTILFSLTACFLLDSSQSVRSGNVQSTDLASIDIAGLRLGLNRNEIDLAQFSPSTAINSTYDIIFQEVRLRIGNVDDITYILGFSINIDGETFDNIEQIKMVLGEHYNEYSFDKEQDMRAITYTDRENNIALTIVYSNTSNAFIWAILSMV